MNETNNEPGLPARLAAQRLIASVLGKARALDEAFTDEVTKGALRDAAAADKGFARAIAGTTLRHLGEIDLIFSRLVEKPLPKRAGPTQTILRTAIAEILFLGVAPHAAVDLAVEAAASDTDARHFKSLVNATLRRLTREADTLREGIDAERASLPDWLWKSWTKSYGEEAARAIIRNQWREAPLDITVKVEADRAQWAERLGAMLMPTGSLRLEAGGRIEALPGFEEGAWWIQDLAAAIPARLLGDVKGRDVLDLCAAPGGKTLELASMGANVTALDRSPQRLDRLRRNLVRTGLDAGIVVEDAARWQPGRTWDFILLDAPCTATGTARRHPDVLHLKTHADRDRLSALQTRILDHAARLLSVGGTLVYCTCSLERQEGPDQIERFLYRHANFARRPVEAAEVGGLAELVTPEGDLRTLPCHLGDEGGMDGFYASRLIRRA